MQLNEIMLLVLLNRRYQSKTQDFPNWTLSLILLKNANKIGILLMSARHFMGSTQGIFAKTRVIPKTIKVDQLFNMFSTQETTHFG